MTKKAYVKIQSNITINVTPGLNHKDLTNKDSDIANRMKVKSTWPKAAVLIKQGQHWYPSDIVNWPTVKALEKDKVLTIGEYSDNPNDDKEVSKEKFDKILKELDIQTVELKDLTLDKNEDDENDKDEK